MGQSLQGQGGEHAKRFRPQKSAGTPSANHRDNPYASTAHERPRVERATKQDRCESGGPMLVHQETG